MARKILIVKLSALGDIIQALEGVQAVDLGDQSIHFTWAVAAGFEPLLENEARVDEIIAVPRRWSLANWMQFRRDMAQRSFDMVVDLQGLLKSWLVGLSVKKKEVVSFGVGHCRDWLVPRCADRTLNVTCATSRASYAQLVEFAIHQDGGGKPVRAPVVHAGRAVRKICMSPGAGWPTKRLDKNQWVELVQLVRNTHPGAVLELLWGTDAEREWLVAQAPLWAAARAEMLPKMDLRELKRYLCTVDLFVGMDSGPAHLAAHMGAAVMLFYGASQPAYYGPRQGELPSFRATCHLGVTFADRCKWLRKCTTCSAIQGIGVREAWREFSQVLEQRDP